MYSQHNSTSMYTRKMILQYNTIEGFQDTVCTYTRTILPRRLVSFLYGAV